MFYILKIYQRKQIRIRDLMDAYAYRSDSKTNFCAKRELRKLDCLTSKIKILVREKEISNLERIFALRNTQEIRMQYAKMMGEMLKSYIRQEIDELRAGIKSRLINSQERIGINQSLSYLIHQIVIFRLMHAQWSNRE